MATASEKRWQSRFVWQIAVTALFVALSLGLAWHFSINRPRQIIREIEALNGKARATYMIDTFIPGLRFPIGVLKDASFLGPQLDDSKLEILERAPRLRFLSLTNTRVTDEGLARLARFRDLEFLVLANIDLIKANGPAWARLSTPPLAGGKGLEALKDLPRFERVRLIGPGTTDEDLKGLTQLKHLLLLELMETRVTDEGIAEFKKALPGCVIRRR